MENTKEMNSAPPRVLDAREAAKYLGLSYFTVRELTHAGKLSSIRLPAPHSSKKSLKKLLFLRSDLDAFLEKYRLEASR